MVTFANVSGALIYDVGLLSKSTGMTQRDGMGRDEGGGFRMGNTCIPMADSFWYMAKPIQYCKVKLNKIKKKRKHNRQHRNTKDHQRLLSAIICQ